MIIIQLVILVAFFGWLAYLGDRLLTDPIERARFSRQP